MLTNLIPKLFGGATAWALAPLLILFLAPAAAAGQTMDTLRPGAERAAGPLPILPEEKPRKKRRRRRTDSIPDAEILSDTLLALQQIQRGPRRALLWSIVPGGGQVHNKRWWKVPIVYGGLLGAVAVADFNQTRYVRFRDALESRCLGEGNVVIIPNADCIPVDADDDIFNGTSSEALLQARNNADRGRQTAYIGILIAYLMQGIEAFSDAHLQRFDVSEDLSFRLGPVVQPDGQMAVGLTVPLGSGRKVRRQERTVERLGWRSR